ncbi:hypothetical protein HUS70_07535 [Pandoraea nosoerga]|uniref:hypothetical protein n=1 Tax=Pandoraea nosoerga TaxID=2508296 RepID=UPI00197CEA17|nr:hypothetical protein [Pandoraea nosoerga]MBN4665413.1 hypothetical protein [Pandoraea nosoerga]MBN4674938.1 hypothetical protein [Pandoraea nosoerga]MBN4680254.1 hypothetical protein [Pandoraea nosoerga]MBN4744513.1 hypothetical protein [Pandoraea nosoerga]
MDSNETNEAAQRRRAEMARIPARLRIIGSYTVETKTRGTLMALNLDRVYQYELLNALADVYPHALDNRAETRAMDDATERKYIANMVYLDEQGLVDSTIRVLGPNQYTVGLPKLTAKGADFLLGDEGLSTILNVVTVKLHADTIKDLIEARIDASTASPEDKSALKKHLSTLSSEAMKTVAKSLVETGLKHVPDVAQWLQTLLPHA